MHRGNSCGAPVRPYSMTLKAHVPRLVTKLAVRHCCGTVPVVNDRLNIWHTLAKHELADSIFLRTFAG